MSTEWQGGPRSGLGERQLYSQVSWYTLDTVLSRTNSVSFQHPVREADSPYLLVCGNVFMGQCIHVYMCVEARGQCLGVSLIVLHLILFYFETASLTETRID